MSSDGLRAGAGALSIIITAGAGLVTNLVTDRPSLAWSVCLGALVLCAVALAVASPLLERLAALRTRSMETTRDQISNDLSQEGLPAVRQVARDGGAAVNAGHNVSMGISGRHLIIIIAILVGASITAVVLLDRQTATEAASTGHAISASTDYTSPPAKHSTSTTGASNPQRRADGPRGRTLNKFTLVMQRGFAYDIDVEPGASAANFGWIENEEADAERDLYLTGSNPLWKIYVPMRPRRDIKPGGLVLIDRTSDPADCSGISQAKGRAFIDSTNASAGDEACLQTGKGRWAMIELIKLPKRETDPVEVEVTLLT
jgi:hypothetical protein